MILSDANAESDTGFKENAAVFVIRLALLVGTFLTYSGPPGVLPSLVDLGPGLITGMCIAISAANLLAAANAVPENVHVALGTRFLTSAAESSRELLLCWSAVAVLGSFVWVTLCRSAFAGHVRTKNGQGIVSRSH